MNNGVNSAKNEGTFTITDGHNDVWCFIEAPKGLAVDETIYPMIQLVSSTDESYEPYTGGIPSPNPDYPQEIKSVVNPVVKVCGKNLLNIDDITITGDGITIIFQNGVGILNGTTATAAYVKTIGKFIAKETGEYYIASATKDNLHEPRILIKVNNGNYESAEKGIVKTLNAGDNVDLYIRISTVATYSNIIIKPMIIRGTYVTYDDYEPYTEQLVQLPYILNAIPVSSGGNVTIDGQQYIADRVVEKDGVFGIERNTATDVPVLTKELRETPDMKGRFIQDGALKKFFTPFYEPLVNIGYSRKWGVAGSVIDKWIFGVNKVNLYISPPKDLNYTSEDIFNALKDLNIKVYGALLVPFFEPLPVDIQAKLRALVTNYPVTNISVTSDQLDGYTVFNYPISMANGWNYVKQQLGDTRDYIYDMDIQSAEAYVNSEYAVALTELEV